MSREIKFRVWDKTTNTMFENDKNTYITIEFFIGMVDINGIKLDYENECEAVLMQYTGLKDKNGKEIYEGDILNILDDSDYGKDYGTPIVHIGEFKDDSLRDIISSDNSITLYGVYFKFNDCTCTAIDVKYVSKFTVIGNIYENPELLGDSNYNSQY